MTSHRNCETLLATADRVERSKLYRLESEPAVTQSPRAVRGSQPHRQRQHRMRKRQCACRVSTLWYLTFCCLHSLQALFTGLRLPSRMCSSALRSGDSRLAGELSKPATDAFLLWLWVGLAKAVPEPSPGLPSEVEARLKPSSMSRPMRVCIGIAQLALTDMPSDVAARRCDGLVPKCPLEAK